MRTAIIVAATLVDVAVGEPEDRFHAVSWLGRLIGALERRRPRDDRRGELIYGAAMTTGVVTSATVVGLCVERALARVPAPARWALTAVALQPAFALRGLVEAAEAVRVALDADIDAARAELIALVSRDRMLDEALVVSAAVESLAENLTDSVTSPLLAYAAGGLPAAYAYRAVNTLDAMIGYRGEYEHVGKAAARLDDVVNYVPARATGLLICLAGALQGRGAAACGALRRGRRAGSGPNKMWTIAPMAGLLGVCLEKPGAYRVGPPQRPLTPQVIDDAVAVTWRVGAAVTGLAGLAAWARGWLRRKPPVRTADADPCG